MNRRLLRRIAICLFALYAFAQGAVALAACSTERGAPPPMAQMGGDCDEGMPQPMQGNLCAAHCNSDLQLTADAVALVQEPVLSGGLRIALPGIRHGVSALAEGVPPPLIPPRVFLHSYLI